MEVRTSSAVVRTLRAGETTLGPAVWGAISVEEGIFLLKTEPRFYVLSKVHDLLCVVAVVGPVRGAIVVIALCEDEDVVTATERILEDGSGTEVDVGIVSGGLVCGGTIKIPNTEGTDVGHFLGDCLLDEDAN